MASVEHWWDDWGGSAYSSEAILGNAATYELGTGLNRGLKTASTFYIKDPNNAAQFVQEWTESFGYDADLDYLTSASYTDGQPNANPTWSYDAAGNRNDATVVDNLNRATTIGGVSRTYDILGNTLTKGSSSMQWDALNRMLQYKPVANQSGEWNYQYRADGMRVKKANFGYQDSTEWTKYMYDGQMPVEETEYSSGQAGSFTTVRRNALGARGIDRIETVASQGTAVAYPVYDGHGNMVATLAKSGAGYTVGNRRSFGAWGDVRQGAASGDPKGRYVANLGHVNDDESGLTYMRARYYESGVGRFLSQDTERDGSNHYALCSNDPVNRHDPSGNSDILSALLTGIMAGLLAAYQTYFTSKGNVAATTAAFLIGFASGFFVSLTANAIADAELKGAFAVMGETMCTFTAGGFINMSATFLINELTGVDSTFGDLLLAFACGGIGGMIGGTSGMTDWLEGLVGGGAMGGIQAAGQEAIHNPL